LGFAYFIEIPEMNGNTPFNILPVGWAHYGFLLELPAILPSSPYDLSNGWVRSRHILARAPWICFYSKDDITYLKRSTLAHDTQCIIFLASNEYSYSLVEKFSTQAPCILVTDNEFLNSYFSGKRNVRIIKRETNALLNDVFPKCYQLLIKVLIDNGLENFSKNGISDDFLRSYCLKKDFLEPGTIGNNFLFIGNQIVFSHTRGKFPVLLDTEKLPTLDTESAINMNINLMNEILSERLVDILLGFENGERIFEPRKISSTLKNKISGFATNYSSLDLDAKRKEYSDLKKLAINEINSPYVRSEITVVVPTVNLSCRKHLISEYQKRIPSCEHEKLIGLLDAILSGGRGIGIDPAAFSQQLQTIFREIGNTRIAENRFLTFSLSLFCSRKLSPILKTTVAPSSLFYDIMKLRAYVQSGYLSKSLDATWCLTTGEQFAALQKKLTENIPVPYLQALQTKPSSVVIVSDLPFELAQLKNEMAICQTLPTTRLPITPLSSMFRYFNLASQMGAVFEGNNFLERILLVNSLQKGDAAYFEYEVFISTCEKLGLRFDSQTVTSSEDFVSAINKFAPSILIYFGHGTYNDEADSGELVFRDNHLSFQELDEIQSVPNIVFLIGCETASCSAFFGGLPPHLLEKGVFSILAPIFPIPGDVAGSFLGRVLAFIKDSTKKNVTVDFSTIVFQARKLGWIMDNLTFLVNLGAITYNEMGEILLETSGLATDLSKERGATIPLNEGIKVFESVLKKHNKFEVWNVNKSNVVIYSLFFTLLGDSSNVMFGGANVPKHIFRRANDLSDGFSNSIGF
jgi:hypothetical protein